MNEELKRKVRFNTLAIVLIIVFSFCISPKTLQNDTFYTISIGEYIIENGLNNKIEPFSWHEGLEYTFPHWAYDVMIYLIYSVGGHLGIYISTIALCAILGILMYLTSSKLMKNRVVAFIITIASLYLLKDYVAARAQLATFILFVATIYCIESFLDTGKKRYAVGLIIIPILIANFHVAVFPFYFILYLPYVVEYMIHILSYTSIIINQSKIDSIHKKILKSNNEEEIQNLKNKLLELETRNDKLHARKEKVRKNAYKITINPREHINKLIIIMIIALFAGFVTPLGLTPYTYLIQTMQGTTTHNISEHLPLTLINNINFMVVLILFIAILTFTDTKIRLCDLFMLGGLTFLTFYTRRQESMFILICSYILIRLICDFLNKYDPEGNVNLEKRLTKILGIIIITALILIVGIPQYGTRYKDEYVSTNLYPVQASEWILNNLDVENMKLYNEYNYGSYLLFKGIPVFIDSRADLYSPEFNKDVNVFTDFIKISGLSSSIEKVEEKIEQYGITHFIMYKNDSKSDLAKYIEQAPEKYELIYPLGDIEDENFYIFEKK